MGDRANLALYRSLGAVMERLPERADVVMATRLARVVGRKGGPAKTNLTNNVRHALFEGPGPVNDELVGRFVDRGFAGYGQYWAEGAKLPALDPRVIAARFAIAEGLEHLIEARARGRGIVMAIPHVGSWEWGGSYLAQIGFPMTAIAEVLEPPELFEWFTRKRQAIGIRIQPLDEHAGTVMLSTLNEGGVVGLLCDRDLQGNGVEVEFFGETVTIPGGPATLALRTGATLVAAACYTGPGRDHFAVITPPLDATREGRLREDVKRITQEIAHELEGLIRRAPEQWHVFQERFATT